MTYKTDFQDKLEALGFKHSREKVAPKPKPKKVGKWAYTPKAQSDNTYAPNAKKHTEKQQQLNRERQVMLKRSVEASEKREDINLMNDTNEQAIDVSDLLTARTKVQHEFPIEAQQKIERIKASDVVLDEHTTNTDKDTGKGIIYAAGWSLNGAFCK